MSQLAPRILSRIPFGPIVCITFALILGFSTPVSADPEGTLYFKGNQTSNYYSIELTNGLVSGVTNLGNPSVNGYAGLAPYGDEPYVFFGSNSTGTSFFRTLSIETGAITPFPFTGSQATGLAFDPETETLYAGYDNYIRAYVGSSYTVIPLPYSSADFHGLAWGEGGLFALEYNDDDLWFYDPNTETWTSRGSTGTSSWNYSGLTYRKDINRLYATRGCRLYEIDPTTATTTDIGSINSASQSPCGGGLAWVPSDCDQNGIADYQDVLDGATDCNGNQVPDICEPDCDQDGVLDECAITTGTSADCDSNGIPDECDEDCDGNGLVDQCEINGGLAQDCDGNGIINPCEPDCDGNGLADACELLGGLASDCDNNGVIDSCDEDCDGNGLADACELLAGTIGDCDGNGIIDPCETDCDLNGVADVCEGRSFKLRQPNISVPCCNTFTDTIEITEPGLIKDVDVKASFSGAWFSTTRIGVTSPSGTTISNLHNFSGNNNNVNGVWSDTLESNTLAPNIFTDSMTVWLNEPAAGIWTMSMNHSGSSGGSGNWNEWGLSFLTDSMPLDCDEDGIPDSCEEDCNGNGIPDDCDIGEGIHRPYQSAIAAPVTINNSAPVIQTITVTDASTVGDLDVFIHYQHDSDCELQIQLTSPAGTNLILKDFGGSCDSVQNRLRYSDDGESGYVVPFESLSSSLNGESLVGDWTLTLTQGAVAPTGVLYAWGILNRVTGGDPDCDGNGIPDSCDIAVGNQIDCDLNGVPDSCEIAADSNLDCDFDGGLDSCAIAIDDSLDCDLNGVLDTCELLNGSMVDCNSNNLPDICEIANQTASDCDLNGVVDDCELVVSAQSINSGGIAQPTINCGSNVTDVISVDNYGTILDVDVQVNISHNFMGSFVVDVADGQGTEVRLHNGTGGQDDFSPRLYDDEGISGVIPQEPLSAFDGVSAFGQWSMNVFAVGCNGSGSWSDWALHFEIDGGVANDCNGNGILDICEINSGILSDCNFNGVPDDCEIIGNDELDCNGNGLLDSCEISAGDSLDCNQNGIPDECDLFSGIPDCNLNGVPDSCDISVFFSSVDCDGNLIPDECQVFEGTTLDCDANGVLDQCEFTEGQPYLASLEPSLPLSFFNSSTESEILVDQPGTIQNVKVSVNISHADVSDLKIEIFHPSTNSGNTIVPLLESQQAFGEDFLGTTFDMSSSNLISDGVAPYSGSYSASGNLNVFVGHDMAGVWILRVSDNGIAIDGVLESWSIEVGTLALNDCNSNGVLDRCESDCNGNGIADECETISQSDVFVPSEFSNTQEINCANKIYEIYVDKNVYVTGVRVFLKDYYYNNSNFHIYDRIFLISPSGSAYQLDVSSTSGTSFPEWVEFACASPTTPATLCIGTMSNVPDQFGQGVWRLETDVSTCSLAGSFSGWAIAFDTIPINDCNDNDVPDDCDISEGIAFDCNSNGVLDSCDATQGTVFDCNGNGIADLCEYGPETDCNGNGILDDCDVLNGIEGDCDGDGVLDSCEVAAGASDCDANEIPDECQPDCDANGTADPCDIASGAADCDADGVLDVCETDCNANGVPDDCDLAAGTSEDCDGDGQPDECQLITGFVDCDNNGLIDVCQLFVEPDLDCDANGTIDFCELLSGTGADCDNNGVLDPCDIAQGYGDCDNDGLPDICEPDDCDGDGVPDACALASGLVEDCDGDELPDSCGIVSGIADDCDGNGIPDICTLIAGIDTDCDLDNVLDACQIIAGASDCDQDGYLDSCALAEGSLPDCDGNGVIDSCDLAAGTSTDTDGDGIPDLCQSNGFVRGECNGDGSISIADAVFLLDHLFVGGPAGPCVKACDGNDDGGVDLSDVIYSLTYLFNGGAPPPHPWPDCGPDPTSDSLPCATAPVCP